MLLPKVGRHYQEKRRRPRSGVLKAGMDRRGTKARRVDWVGFPLGHPLTAESQKRMSGHELNEPSAEKAKMDARQRVRLWPSLSAAAVEENRKEKEYPGSIDLHRLLYA